MKKFYFMLKAMLIMSAMAMSGAMSAQDASFNFMNGDTEVNGVTASYAYYSAGADIWNNHWESFSLKFNGGEHTISKITFQGAGEVGAGISVKDGIGTFSFDATGTSVWEGSAKEIVFWGESAETDYYVAKADVWFGEGGGDNGGDGDGETYTIDFTTGWSASYTSGSVTATATSNMGNSINLYGSNTSDVAPWGTLNLLTTEGTITKVVLHGDQQMGETIASCGSITSSTSTLATWEGSSDKIVFSSNADVYVTSIDVTVSKDENGGGSNNSEPSFFDFFALDWAYSYTDGDVTVIPSWYGQYVNLYGSSLESAWGVTTVQSAGNGIVKVEMVGDHDMDQTIASCGEFTELTATKAVWEGNATEVKFSSNSDVILLSMTVTLGSSAGEDNTPTEPTLTEQTATLPYHNNLSTEAKRNQIEIYDGNHNGSTFMAGYYDADQNWYYCINTDGADTDDYLVLPGFELQAGKQYYFSVDVFGTGTWSGHYFDVIIGKEPKLSAMTDYLIDQWTYVSGTDVITKENESFTVEEDGTYYIALHNYSYSWNGFFCVDNFVVEEVDLDKPSPVDNIFITPGAQGALSASIVFSMPTTTIGGTTYDSNKELTYVLSRNGSVIDEQTAKAGDLVFANDTNADLGLANGYSTYSVVIVDGVHESKAATNSAYIGEDAPLGVEEVFATSSTDSITLTWTPVTKGSNGGYVNPTYNVYPYEGYYKGERINVEPITGTTFTFAYPTNEGTQGNVRFCVTAETKVDETWGTDVNVLVGAPYTMPYVVGQFLDNDSTAFWSSDGSFGAMYRDAWSDLSSDGDGVSACIYGYNEDASIEFTTGKICLMGKAAKLSFDLKNECLTKIHVIVNDANGVKYEIKDFELEANEGFETVSVVLKGDFSSTAWIRASIVFEPTELYKYLYLDNVQINEHNGSGTEEDPYILAWDAEGFAGLEPAQSYGENVYFQLESNYEGVMLFSHNFTQTLGSISINGQVRVSSLPSQFETIIARHDVVTFKVMKAQEDNTANAAQIAYRPFEDGDLWNMPIALEEGENGIPAIKSNIQLAKWYKVAVPVTSTVTLEMSDPYATIVAFTAANAAEEKEPIAFTEGKLIAEGAEADYDLFIKVSYNSANATLTLTTEMPEPIVPVYIENVLAEVGLSEANEWGDQFFTVTLTVPAAELDSVANPVKAYAPEGVTFFNDSTASQFTLNATELDGKDVVAGEDLTMKFVDMMVATTTDTSYEMDLREQGTFAAHSMIVITDADDNEVAYAEFRGELTFYIEPTGVQGIALDNASLIIYNLNGQRVDKANGIVIINGKKVLVK
ncbi:MAG: hypothetical protein KBT20_02340 [Bacteroidales bacterium]|nr:hypothetical protein [Candidatus Liminaster caballi]